MPQVVYAIKENIMSLIVKWGSMFVTAMNPCPCGYYPSSKCRCTDYEIIKYRGKISGPIMDRIDIQ